MADHKSKKPMTASDYIKNQPHLQGKPLTTQNTFSALADFPPLSYVSAVTIQKGQTSPVPSSPIQTTKTSYFTKPQKQHLLTTHYTKPITLKELQTFTNRVFYPDGLYPNDNITKNRTFYEYILVDSGSVEITHYPDKKDPNLISYSTCKILNIKSVQDLGFIHNHTIKPFSTPGYHIQGYTYIDYINAFTRTFYLRPYDHSWFISFDRNCQKTIPAWFYEWWHWLGPTAEIYPTELLKSSYPYYLKNIQKKDIEVLNIIAFHIDMGIPWICSWHFNVAPFLPNLPGSLLREFRIKWWEKFNLDRCSLTNIQKYFQISKDVHKAIQAVSRSVPLLNPHQLATASTSTPTQPAKTRSKEKIQSPTHSTTSSKSSARRSAKDAKLKKIIATISKHMESSSDEEDDIISTKSIQSEDIIGGQDPFDF